MTKPTAEAAVSTWNLDPAHSVAEFKIKHMMIANVRGEFGKLSGRLHLDEGDITRSMVEAVIEAASINTHEPQRDTHLKSADFFDVEKYPQLTFRSTRVERKGDGLKVTGTLTIHGVSREVELAVEGPTAPAKDPWGGTRIGISASTKISRKDFGLTYNQVLEAGGLLVGDEVTIALEAQFVRSEG
ncbi:MAG: YceI family protein [Terriglobales bacterium]